MKSKTLTLRNDPMTPMGLPEIADALNVPETTAYKWHSRKLLPEPRWEVGRRACWAWADVEAWGREKRLLPPLRVRALTIRQPYASLIMQGIKDVENRTWQTHHRGVLAIHAAKKVERDAAREHDMNDAPTSCLLGTVELVDCVRDHRSKWAEPDAWHFVLANPRPLAEPIPMNGKLGIWDLPPEVLDLLD